jgi:hypothetical protein
MLLCPTFYNPGLLLVRVKLSLALTPKKSPQRCSLSESYDTSFMSNIESLSFEQSKDELRMPLILGKKNVNLSSLDATVSQPQFSPRLNNYGQKKLRNI